MKKWILLVAMVYAANVYCQDRLPLNQIKFDQIRSTHYDLPPLSHIPLYEDSAVNFFLKRGKKSLRFLIEKITDTSLTNIQKGSKNEFYKKGDLAIILLSNIEFIPYSAITGDQWCICCETGYLPVGFLAYVDKDRGSFQSKYKRYCIAQKQKRNARRT